MKLKLIILIALSLIGTTQANAKSHKSRHTHHRAHQWIFLSKAMCERSEWGSWNKFYRACRVYNFHSEAKKICRALGGRLPTLRELNSVVRQCSGGHNLVNTFGRQETPFYYRKLGYQYTSCLKRAGFIDHGIGDTGYFATHKGHTASANLLHGTYNPNVGTGDELLVCIH